MGLSIGLSIGMVQRRRGGFSLLSLFAGGAEGVWFDPSDLSTLFQLSDGTTPVTADGQVVGRGSDKSGNGNHLLQSVNAVFKPVYHTDGTRHWIEGDGVDDWLRAAFTISQPWERISALRAITWTANDRIFGGGAADSGLFYQLTSSPNHVIFSGTNLDIADPALDTDFVLTERHNGASSRGAINGGAYVTGNAGTTAPGGITIFGNQLSGGGNQANARCYGLVMREGVMTDAEIANTRAYLAAKAGVTL